MKDLDENPQLTSFVWKKFGHPIIGGQSDHERLVCTACNAVVSIKGRQTSGARNHWLNFHNDLGEFFLLSISRGYYA